MILALDLATKTGICWGAGDCLPSVSHVTLPKTGEDVGAFLCAFEDWLRERVSEIEPTAIVFEAPILATGTTPHVTRKLHAQAGVTEMVALRLGIDCREVYPVTVKKALTGSGRAKKPEMVAAARAFGLTIATEDEADAFGVWLAMIRAQKPQFSARWTPLFAGSAA